MKPIAIIPARGGSTRIPRKNIKPFHGKPIIAYSIDTARQSELFEAIYVSTEDGEIADIAVSYGAKIIWRDPRDSADYVGTQEVTRKALLSLQAAGMPLPELTCCIYATAPLMKDFTLKVTKFQMGISAHSMCAYSYTIHNWEDAAQCYWGWTRAFLNQVPLEHWSARRYDVGPERFCDINTPEDWARAESMYIKLDKDATP